MLQYLQMLKKEIIIAIIIGLVISLIIGGGIFRAKQALNHIHSQQTPSPSSSASTSANLAQDSSKPKLFLKITSPHDNYLSKEDQLTLTGETLPNTYITIVTDKSEYLIVPNKVGQFSQSIQLIKGANLIKVTVYTKTGQHQTKTLTVVYTTAEI